MDSTEIEDPQKPVTGEAAIAGAASLSMMETMHQDNSPLVTTGDTSPIIQALHIVQVIYLVFAGIIALAFSIYNIVAFAVLLVAFSVTSVFSGIILPPQREPGKMQMH